MSNDDFIISGFGNSSDSSLFAVDFSLFKTLERSGSTCNAFEGTVQRRHLFIKRLKPQFRENALYRAAFDKEYDLGVSLNHISLPRYVGLGSDYIAMDFIEGETLAELIKNNSTRLKNRDFVKKILFELVDVVDYLHRRGVVHCDIKPDNIIVSSYDDRPIKLIDLDKAYTSWLETTHGNTEKYGCRICADGKIDFKGIGLIAEKLGDKRFARRCVAKNVSPGKLKKFLTQRKSPLRFVFAAVAVIGLIAVSASIAVLTVREKNVAESRSPHVDPVSDSIAVESESPVEVPVVLPVVAPAGPTIEMVDEIVRRYYGPLRQYQVPIEKYLSDTTLILSSLQIKEELTPYADLQMQAQAKIFKDVCELYKLEDPSEALLLLCKGKEWRLFMNADRRIYKLCAQIEKRRDSRDSVEVKQFQPL